jgi:hypothetical protein
MRKKFLIAVVVLAWVIVLGLALVVPAVAQTATPPPTVTPVNYTPPAGELFTNTPVPTGTPYPGIGCPAYDVTPVGWGTVTPSDFWSMECGDCFVDVGTVTPGATSTLEMTATPAVSPTPDYSNVGWTFYDDLDAGMIYEGTWNSGSGFQWTNQAGASVEFDFVGSGFQYIGGKNWDFRDANEVWLDGEFVTTFSAWNSGLVNNGAVLYEQTGLDYGEHTIKLVVGGNQVWYRHGGVNVEEIQPTPTPTITPIPPTLELISVGASAGGSSAVDSTLYDCTQNTESDIVCHVSFVGHTTLEGHSGEITLYFNVRNNGNGGKVYHYIEADNYLGVETTSQWNNAGENFVNPHVFEGETWLGSGNTDNWDIQFNMVTYSQPYNTPHDGQATYYLSIYPIDQPPVIETTPTPSPFEGLYCSTVNGAGQDLDLGFGFDLFVEDGALNCNVGWEEFGFLDYTIPAVQICLQPVQFGVVEMWGEEFEMGLLGLVILVAFAWRYLRTV